MARTASKLLEEQLSLARRILSPQPAPGDLLVRDIMRLASLTLEIHHKLSSGTPFPSVWLTAGWTSSDGGDDGRGRRS
jgi:hypothetical protein